MADYLPQRYQESFWHFLHYAPVPAGDGRNRYAYTIDLERWIEAYAASRVMCTLQLRFSTDPARRSWQVGLSPSVGFTAGAMPVFLYWLTRCLAHVRSVPG